MIYVLVRFGIGCADTGRFFEHNLRTVTSCDMFGLCRQYQTVGMV